MRKSLILVISALACGLLAMPSAFAQSSDNNTVCTGPFLSGVHDNVVVPPTASCTIIGAEIRGDLVNYGNASVNSTEILGDLESYFAVDIDLGQLGPVTVHQSVQVIGTAAGQTVNVLGSDLHGNFSFLENKANLQLHGNTVGGNVKAQKNTGGGTMSGNTIRGNLECKENVPQIFDAGNVFTPNAGGQDKCPEA
jgi:hypothetical protein